MKKMNLYFGLLLFIVFLGTGYYMLSYFQPENVDNHVMRMQIRSNHIYLLFIALLNIVAFNMVLTAGSKISRYLDPLFRMLIVVAGLIAMIAFYHEHTGDINLRMWTFSSVLMSVVSIGLVLLNEFICFIAERKST